MVCPCFRADGSITFSSIQTAEPIVSSTSRACASPRVRLQRVWKMEEGAVQHLMHGAQHEGVRRETHGVHDGLRDEARLIGLSTDHREVVGVESLPPGLQRPVVDVDMARQCPLCLLRPPLVHLARRSADLYGSAGYTWFAQIRTKSADQTDAGFGRTSGWMSPSFIRFRRDARRARPELGRAQTKYLGRAESSTKFRAEVDQTRLLSSTNFGLSSAKLIQDWVDFDTWDAGFDHVRCFRYSLCRVGPKVCVCVCVCGPMSRTEVEQLWICWTSWIVLGQIRVDKNQTGVDPNPLDLGA